MGSGGDTLRESSRLGPGAARNLIAKRERVKSSCNWGGGGMAPGMSTGGHTTGSTSAMKELHKAGGGEAEPHL